MIKKIAPLTAFCFWLVPLFAQAQDAGVMSPPLVYPTPIRPPPAAQNQTPSPSLAERALLNCLNSCDHMLVCGPQPNIERCLRSQTAPCMAISVTMNMASSVLGNICHAPPLPAAALTLAPPNPLPSRPDTSAQRRACENSPACRSESGPAQASCVTCCMHGDTMWVPAAAPALRDVMSVSGLTEYQLRCVRRDQRPLYGMISGIASNVAAMRTSLQSQDQRIAAVESANGGNQGRLNEALAAALAMFQLQQERDGVVRDGLACINGERLREIERRLGSQQHHEWATPQAHDEFECEVLMYFWPTAQMPPACRASAVVSRQMHPRLSAGTLNACHIDGLRERIDYFDGQIASIRQRFPVDPRTLNMRFQQVEVACEGDPTSSGCREARNSFTALLNQRAPQVEAAPRQVVQNGSLAWPDGGTQ